MAEQKIEIVPAGLVWRRPIRDVRRSREIGEALCCKPFTTCGERAAAVAKIGYAHRPGRAT